MSSDTQHLRRRRLKAFAAFRKERGIAAMRARGISWMLPAGWFAGVRSLGERCCALHGHKVERGEKCPRCGWIVGESHHDHTSRMFVEAYSAKTVLEAFNKPNPFIRALRGR